MKTARHLKATTLAAASLAALTLTSTAPAQTRDTFVFSPNRPRLVVLLHGVTQEPKQDKEIGIGTLKHPRHYWGIDLIQGLTGWPQERANRVVTPTLFGKLNFDETSRWDWYVDKYHGPLGSHLAPVVFPLGNFGGTKWKLNAQKDIQSYISLSMNRGEKPGTAVMVAYRDGSKHLMPQTADTINQVYRTYKTVFGHLPEERQPQIYFVGHSFGGVVARAIMANPTGADLWGNTLTPSQRESANFLRNRTVFITTLSSPHTGTLISDLAGDINDNLKATGGNIDKALTTVPGMILSALFSALGLSSDIRKELREGVAAGIDSVAGERDCLEDLTRMPEYNRGILLPDTCRREDGSYVPIYTTSGRTPGGMYFDRSRKPSITSWQSYSVLDLFSGGQAHGPMSSYWSKRGAFEAAALYVTESILHNQRYGAEGERPWGTARSPFMDRVISPFTQSVTYSPRPVSDGLAMLSPDFIGPVAKDLYFAAPYRIGADRQNDSDGFLGIESGHAMGLRGPFIRVLDPNQWGGWLPWEQDNHGSMMFNPGTGSWIFNELLEQAGPRFVPDDRISSYLGGATPKPQHDVKVELLGVHENVAGTFDWGGEPDFTIQVRIEDQATTFTAPDDTRTWTLFKPVFKETPSSVIPIRISVIDRDYGDNYDLAVTSQTYLKDNLYLYFDTRTQKIFGDVNGDAGEVISTYNNNNYKGVGLKFRITGN